MNNLEYIIGVLIMEMIAIVVIVVLAGAAYIISQQGNMIQKKIDMIVTLKALNRSQQEQIDNLKSENSILIEQNSNLIIEIEKAHLEYTVLKYELKELINKYTVVECFADMP
jgi:hypothetical protein